MNATNAKKDILNGLEKFQTFFRARSGNYQLWVIIRQKSYILVQHVHEL